MLESKRTGNLTTYIQGSVWSWHPSNSTPDMKGVQSSGRPVLIISNNTFNQWSSSVNCLTITSVLKPSPVHVEITLDTLSHIQCEQIHTISKNELTEYKGVVPAIILSNVKEKIKIQYDMNTDRSLEILIELKDSIDKLNEKASDGFGLQALTGEVSHLLLNTHNCFEHIKAELAKIQCEHQDNHVNNAEPIKAPTVEIPAANGSKTKRRVYSDEDIRFITDESHSVDEVMEKFGFKNKGSVYSARYNFKRKDKEQKNHNYGKVGKRNGQSQRRSYTDEDKQFITNGSNSIAEIMDRFNYKNKAVAYKMRSYFRKHYSNTDHGQ